MNVLVVGRSGQLATELMRYKWPDGTRVTAFGRPGFDVADFDAVTAAFVQVEPSLVVNAAAYTAVDRAEAEPDAAMAVNYRGARNLAEASARRGVPLIHVSTDYVFDGRGERPWREDDRLAPLGSYGRSKLAGERAIQESLPRHIILRSSWVFAAHGQNFVRTMLRLGAERPSLSIVDDQLGCPTSAADLARVIVEIGGALAQGSTDYGTYHYTGSGPVTWFGFAQAIFAAAGLPKSPELHPITTADFAAPAPRPAYSVLDCGKIGRVFGIAQRPWSDELRAVIAALRVEGGAAR
ncbi:MAG TPA: dTDP-4-dehydrorhamnose reductase [Stellaceae bacterium]|nr:dTDP-4-dehydrorhamnose reductase [Stellaceae bacterium]